MRFEAIPHVASTKAWSTAQKICVAMFTVLCFFNMELAGQERVDSAELLVDSESVIYLSDSTAMENIFPVDTVTRHQPAKAAMMSAVLPGLGQIYNRKYWKVPIVYAAVGVSVYIFLYYQNYYNRFRRAYIDLNDGDPNTNYFEILLPTANNEQRTQMINRGREQTRTWRDWSIVAVVGAYALNIIDANVDAHLIDFSLDDNISMNIQPCFFEEDFHSKKIGLSLRFTF